MTRTMLMVCLVAAMTVFQTARTGNGDQPANPAQDLFAAMEAGDVGVRLIPKNSKTGNVLIENKTKKPLTIKLPEAFAGVPVLAQFGGGGLGGGGLGGGGGGQGLGGGFGGGGLGGGGGGFGGGGGVFNIAPEQVRKLKVATVCLEHGKDDPTPRMNYTLKPIESFTDKPEVIELCKLVGSGKVDQQAAQAAAWHLANGMSWQQLARKVGKRHLNGSVEPYFFPRQLALAAQIANEAVRRGQQQPSPGRDVKDEKFDSLSRR